MSTEQTLEALSEALDDEYRARAPYRKVIERFGPVRPFVNIVDAENRHIAAPVRQFQRLHARPPADTWRDRVTAPQSLAQACVAGSRPRSKTVPGVYLALMYLRFKGQE
ncbi:MAG: hypothetical protein WA459_08485 [Stellaceae bacterium]